MRRLHNNRAIGHIGLDAFLDRQRLAALALHTDVITVAPGTVLARAGRFARQFVAVIDGDVDVTDGSAHTHVAGPGSHIGGAELLHRQPHEATFVTRTECLVIVIYGPALAATFGHPDVVSWVEQHRAVTQRGAIAARPARDLAPVG